MTSIGDARTLPAAPTFFLLLLNPSFPLSSHLAGSGFSVSPTRDLSSCLCVCGVSGPIQLSFSCSSIAFASGKLGWLDPLVSFIVALPGQIKFDL
jgi:hypothetical protein